MAQQEDLTKKFRKYFQSIGPLRFIVSILLILAGIAGKYLFFIIFPPIDETTVLPEMTSYEIVLSPSYFLSFWPLFWAVIITLSLLWWVMSGFKSATGLIISFIAGMFMTELMMPGTLFSFEELPIYFSILGLVLFVMPGSAISNPLSVFKRPSPQKKRRSSSRRKKRTDPSNENNDIGINVASNSLEKQG